MTGAWSRSPVGRVVRLAELGALGGNLGENNGESRRVCRLQKYPDWIFKEYRAPVSAGGARRLNRLINLPAQMTATEKALVDAHISWPSTRVVDGQQQTIGVLMPLAPAAFSTTRQMPSGRSECRPLEVDVLALTEDHQTHIKLPPQSLPDRISVCASITTIGALLERRGLVYLDWSYANVFWSLNDHTAYVIDLDGCSFGPRSQIQSPNWEDPLVPRGRFAGNESDRYRVALLTARCLTGKRARLEDTRSGLFSLRLQGGATGEVAGLLIRAINAKTTAERPSIAELSTALRAAKRSAPRVGGPQATLHNAGGVVDWRPLTARGGPAPKPNVGTHPRQTGPRPAPQAPWGTPSGRTGRTPVYPVTSSFGRPVGPRNIPAPARPSSGPRVMMSVAALAILVIVVLVILL